MSHGGPDYSVTTSGGSGLVMIGTTFPVTPYVDELFYRTDLDLLCRWNGTYWLSENEYSFSVSEQTGIAAISSWLFPTRYDYLPYVTRVIYRAHVNTTNDGSNYWVLKIQDQALTPAAPIGTNFNQNTSADTLATWTEHEGTPNVIVPALTRWLSPYVSKVGAPGTLDFGCTFYYRLVVT